MSITVVKGKTKVDINREDLLKFMIPYKRIVLDIGTGDGKYILKSARSAPTTFFIGIDPSAQVMEESSKKINRKISKGGVTNALFVLSRVENLPHELDGIAEEIHINMPWGSLLEGLIMGEQIVLQNITRVAKPDAKLEILINYSIFHGERVSQDMSHLPLLTYEYIDEYLSDKYLNAGLVIVERELVGKNDIVNMNTVWAKKLAYGREPRTIRIRATINPDNNKISTNLNL